MPRSSPCSSVKRYRPGDDPLADAPRPCHDSRVDLLKARAALQVLVAATIAVTAPWSGRVSADEGWIIERFASDIQVQPDGALRVTESLDVDFGTLQRHGIFRTVPIRYEYDATHVRVYQLAVRSVTDGAGRAIRYDRSDEGANAVIKIGDPDRTVSGPQSYRVTYDVRGALNAFADHDELFWNATGAEWPVPVRAASATVTLGGPITRVTCFQGPERSQEQCRASLSGTRAEFVATRTFSPGEQLTIVTAFAKGVVSVPPPILEGKARDLAASFEPSPLAVGSAVFIVVAGLALIFWRWYSVGRDAAERSTIVPEYEPPDRLRPAQLGLLVDERADTKDVTATIVDLAVRGYLRIVEVAGQGFLSKKDWRLAKTVKASTDLLPYEDIVYQGLFAGRDSVLLSELRTHFVTQLAAAESALYKDSLERRWFTARPDRVRTAYGLASLAIVLLGIGLAWLLGTQLGIGLLGVAVAFVGFVAMPMSRVMAAKTAAGAELLRRTLGFRRYMEVAEKERERFAERENIFSQYLPYAIVFGCVEKWARAFAGIDTAAQTAGWYVGGSPFSSGALSSSLQGFNGSLGSALAATPGSSGHSGFSSGGAGGGGGGGGGGSW